MQSLVRDHRALGCEEITLLGGEVFLRPDWLAIAAEVRAQGMRLVIVTNGLLVDGALASTLAALDPYVVGVSIDGATAETYREVRRGDGFDASMRAIHRLLDAGCKAVNAITTFHRGNLQDFSGFVALFDGTPVNWQVQIAGKGGDRFPDELFFTADDYLTFSRRIHLARENHPRLRLSTMDDFGYYPLAGGHPSLSRWPGCHAGVSLLGIRSNGDVLPCMSLGDDFIVSNVRREPLESIWKNDAYFADFRDKERRLVGACAACDVKHLCRGGCSEVAHSVTGHIFEDPYCLRAMERSRLVGLICDEPTGSRPR